MTDETLPENLLPVTEYLTTYGWACRRCTAHNGGFASRGAAARDGAAHVCGSAADALQKVHKALHGVQR